MQHRSLAMIAFIILVVFCSMIYLYKKENDQEYDFIDIVGQHEFEREEGKKETATITSALDQRFSKSDRATKKFYFNPNIIGEDSLKLLGLDPKVIGNLMKYRKAGGRIKSKEKFFQIYGMERYKSLDTLLQFDDIKKSFDEKVNTDKASSGNSYSKKDDENTDKGSNVNSYSKKDTFQKKRNDAFNSASKIQIVTITIVELNGADSLELVAVRGIGEKLASRIIKYRDLLGGYYNKEQLEEVYGLKAEHYMNIEHLLKVDVSKIKRIDINKIEEKILSKHPYFGRKFASIICNYRGNHGNFKSMDDFKKIKAFTEEDFEKMKWYLEFKNT